MFVWINKQGLYLRFSVSHTHTGTHSRYKWVSNINDASVSLELPRALKGLDVRRLAAKEEVRVSLVEPGDSNEKENGDVDDYPMPAWADCRATGSYLELNAQLCTRDGRKVGNAQVVDVTTDLLDPDLKPIVTIRTDKGNKLRFTESELAWLFWPPVFVMKNGA